MSYSFAYLWVVQDLKEIIFLGLSRFHFSFPFTPVMMEFTSYSSLLSPVSPISLAHYTQAMWLPLANGMFTDAIGT